MAAGYSGKQMLALNLTLGDGDILKAAFLLRGVVGRGLGGKEDCQLPFRLKG